MLTRLFRDLAPYSPTLVGTFPLGLQVEGSDIDIACSGPLAEIGAALEPYAVARISGDTLVAAFAYDDLPIEVFAQSTPIHTQAGFRHMIVEGRLLALGGSVLRERVLAAKRAGTKTEPAFAELLGLPGDPYAALLALETATYDQLRELVAAATSSTPTPPRHMPPISEHQGDRATLLPSLRLADDSEREIEGYVRRGIMLVASDADTILGHVQMLAEDPLAPGSGGWELKSLAVAPAWRGTGLGKRLVRAGLELAGERGARRVVLSTSTADAQLLRFYQRLGFRMIRIDLDVFTPAAGYPVGLEVEGVPVLDRVWFERGAGPRG